MKKSQNGFVLISVLLITSISTFYALSEVKGNQLQERIGGNQQKEMNARLLAEKGVFDSVNYIKSSIPAPMSIGQIAINLDGGQVNVEGSIEVTVIDDNAKFIYLLSKGTVDGAEALLRVNIDINNLHGEKLTKNAIIACEAASLTGGGIINSYDSLIGPYSNTNSGDLGSVTTINGDVLISGGTDLSGGITASGNVNQSGSTEIKGSITASGNIELAQATVAGSIHSGGTVDLTGGSVGATVDGVVEGGNVTAFNDLTLSGSQIEGNVNTAGNATITGGVIGSSTAIDPTGNVDVTKNLTIGDDSTISKGSTMYGGTLSTPYESYDSTSFSSSIENTVPTITAVRPTIESEICDPLDVANNMPILTGVTSSNAFASGSSGGKTLRFNENKAETHVANTSVFPQSINSTLIGGNKKAYVLDSLNLGNTMIEISGDVTIVVTGALTTGGDNSGFKFADNDTTSSLTILTEGTVNLSSSASFFDGSGINSQGEVPLNLISSNTSDQAITLAGAANSYAKIYAPLGGVLSTASGQLMGSVRGRNVTVTGAGGIHFDEQIKNTIDKFTDGSGTPVYTSIFYYYD